MKVNVLFFVALAACGLLLWKIRGPGVSGHHPLPPGSLNLPQACNVPIPDEHGVVHNGCAKDREGRVSQ